MGIPMKNNKWAVFLIICLGLAACTLPTRMKNSISYVPPLQAWIDAPLDNYNIPLLPYKVIFHGAGTSGVDEFELKINGMVIATIPATPSKSGEYDSETLFLGEYLWTPPTPGTYLISVRVQKQGEFSNEDQVRVIVDGEEAEVIPTSTLTPTLTITPTLTLTPSHTPTATQREPVACIFTALMGLNCRDGPGIIFNELDSFVKDQSAVVVGKSTAGYHWYVIGPNFGRVCAVPNDPVYGKTEGDCDEKPLFTPPPTPTLTESPSGCTVRQSGGDIICVYPCPAGAVPGNPCRP
jgi:hypothetical protein